MQKWWKRLLWRGKGQKKSVLQLKLEKIEKQKELLLKQNTYAKQDDYPLLPVTYVVVGCDINLKDCTWKKMHLALWLLIFLTKMIWIILYVTWNLVIFKQLSASCYFIKVIAEWCLQVTKPSFFFGEKKWEKCLLRCTWPFLFHFIVNFLVILLLDYALFWCHFKLVLQNREYSVHGWNRNEKGPSLNENLNKIRSFYHTTYLSVDSIKHLIFIYWHGFWRI